jgi:hypothetical protein
MKGQYVCKETEGVVNYTREEFIISVQSGNDDDNLSDIDENYSCSLRHPSICYSQFNTIFDIRIIIIYVFVL